MVSTGVQTDLTGDSRDQETQTDAELLLCTSYQDEEQSKVGLVVVSVTDQYFSWTWPWRAWRATLSSRACTRSSRRKWRTSRCWLELLCVTCHMWSVPCTQYVVKLFHFILRRIYWTIYVFWRREATFQGHSFWDLEKVCTCTFGLGTYLNAYVIDSYGVIRIESKKYFWSWDVVAVKRKDGNMIVGVKKTPLYVKMVKADLAVCVCIYLLTSNIQYQCKLGRRTKQSIGHFLLSISIFIWFIIYYIDIDEMDRQGNLIKAHVKCQIHFYIFWVFKWLDFSLYI